VDNAGNPIYVVAENGTDFLITEDGNTPQINELTYNQIFKPHIELYWSDDGGISFFPADVLEFSHLVSINGECVGINLYISKQGIQADMRKSIANCTFGRNHAHKEDEWRSLLMFRKLNCNSWINGFRILLIP